MAAEVADILADQGVELRLRTRAMAVHRESGGAADSSEWTTICVPQPTMSGQPVTLRAVRGSPTPRGTA
jgi:hypothetical protein